MRTSHQVICDQLDQAFVPHSFPKRRRRKSKHELDKEVDRGMFDAYREIAKVMGESNDCSVRAVAACCGVTYQQAHEACARHGRVEGRGMDMFQILKVVASFGFTVKRINVADEIGWLATQKNYHVKNLTTRQVAMFADHFSTFRDWDAYPGVLLSTRGHIAAFSKGRVHDFGASRALRVDAAWKVVKA